MSVLAANFDIGDHLFTILTSVLVIIGSVVNALIANRGKNAAQGAQASLLPNGGSSSYDQIIAKHNELAAKVDALASTVSTIPNDVAQVIIPANAQVIPSSQDNSK